MITAVDTNILLDVLVPGAPHGDASEQALTESLRAGATVISEAVYAELAAHFPLREELDRFLEDTGIRPYPSGAEALNPAGRAWHEYLRRRPFFSLSFLWSFAGRSLRWVCSTSPHTPARRVRFPHRRPCYRPR